MSEVQGGESPRSRRLELDGCVIDERPRPSPEEEAVHARTIQIGNVALGSLVEQLAGNLTGSLLAIDATIISKLPPTTLRGAIRAAFERHALLGAGGFVESVASTCRDTVAAHIDGNAAQRRACGCDGNTWVTRNLTRKILEDGTSALGIDPATWAALRAREEAILALANSHLRVVAAVLASRRGRGQDDPDMVQRGYLALRRAAEAFAPEGCAPVRFATYARTAVTHEFDNARRESSGVSVNASRQIAQFHREEARLSHSLGRTPSEQHVLDHLGWSPTRCRNFRRALARVRGAGDAGLELHPGQEPDLLASQGEADAITPQDEERLHAAWAALDPIQQEVLTARYFQSPPESRRALASRLGETYHAVRRLEEEARDRLREAMSE